MPSDPPIATVLPADFRERWKALFDAVVRQESMLSRFSKRLVTPEEHRIFKNYIRTYWDRLLTTVMLTGPNIIHPRWASEQSDVLQFLIEIGSKYMRARTEAANLNIATTDLTSEDNGWIHLMYPPGTHFAPGT